MRLRRYLMLLAIVAVAVSAVAYPATAMVGGTFVTFKSTNSGLPSNDVRAICEDGSGRIWIGTANGLSRFDGTTWKTFTTADSLAHNTVNALAYELTSHGQEIWAGTDGGVSVVSVDGTTCATPYRTTNTSYPGMISNKITSVAVDSQHVRWFGSDLGLMSFGTSGWKSYTTDSTGVKLADNHINAIAYEQTSYGPEIWVGTNNGISVINTKIDAMSYATPYRTTNGNYPGMVSDLILSATMDSVHNTRWFGTDKGLIAFKSNTFTSYTMADFLPDSCVTSVGVSGVTGKLYVGTQTAGASEFDAITTATTVDTEWSGIASNNIRAVVVGKYGAVWFATDKGVTQWFPPDLDSDVAETQPISIAIKGNYPNPFNPSTTIEFALEKPGYAVLSVYNVSGQLVRELTAGSLAAGAHAAVWDGRDHNGTQVASGTYFAQLRFGNTVINRKMLLMK